MLRTLLLAGSLLTPIVPSDPYNAPQVPACETIQDLNPTGELYDMVDWTTLDADLRATNHMAAEPYACDAPVGCPYVLQTKVAQDRITYLKTPTGDTWDVNLVDDVGIWAWRTETHWNTPHSFTQFRHVGQVLHAPRFGRGGFPGMRWINCDSAYFAHEECGLPSRYGHLGYIIHELWGPYDYEPGWGDVRGKILKIVYYYGCSTTSTDSCTAAEVTWLSKRYGQFGWRLYTRAEGGWVLTNAPPVVAYLVPGVIDESFPCDEEMP